VDSTYRLQAIWNIFCASALHRMTSCLGRWAHRIISVCRFPSIPELRQGGHPSGGNSLNRARIGSKEVENHEGLATGLQEGIGAAIDHTNQRAFTTELSGDVRVASLHANTRFTTAAKLGVLTGRQSRDDEGRRLRYVGNSPSRQLDGTRPKQA
jgi:hypothetical protein